MLKLHFANSLTPRIGDAGIDPAALDAAAPDLARLTDRLAASRGRGWERWRNLAVDPSRSEHLAAVKALVERDRPRTEQLVVLGIGGSALGNSAVHAALTPATWNLLPPERRDGPRLFVLDNVDPHVVGATLDEVHRADPGFRRTIVNVISKSGETAETAAQFLVVRARLEAALGPAWADRVVAVTDPARGTMRRICDEAGIATLPVPDGVGGRFSVLSPVGLYSAAMCGIDVDALLDGAADMDGRCSDLDARRNPAAILAWILIEHTRRGRANHVLMPYANRLYPLADWYRQLWAESLGKRVDLDGREVFAGATPIKALGATDQHSQVQLYREGPDDKVIGFVEIADHGEDVVIPGGAGIDALDYLGGSSLRRLLAAEKRATEYALVESRRPNYTIALPRLDAHAVGEFLQLWMVTTAYAGLMLNIDAYDQPAVETGKVATFGLMGKEGYEEWRERVDGVLTETEWVV